MALEHGVMLSKTSPAFLHGNSTSHTWCFSAVAEIIDNAYDPDVGATELRIDRVLIKGMECLSFTDNGNGMTPDKLHHMLSFGYCEKVEIAGHKPVGQYGNGFKSGSMRLGKDAVVFTKCKTTWSVGFLSQTFLAAIKADTVLVPIITFDKVTNVIAYREDTEGSLKSIFSHSIFTTMNSVLREYGNLDGHETGTRIIIYNLKRGADNMLELDFNSNAHDIINPEHHEFDQSSGLRVVKEYTPEYRKSLREYCSILFLKPRMKIFIRGTKVRTKFISKSLRKMEVALYRPRSLEKPVKIIFGFGQSTEDFGIMLYHRNRLIKAYERIGCQNKQTGQGVGVVGVVEVDFLEPVHNKQDFNKTDRYNAFMNTLAQKLNDYWQETTNTSDGRQTPAPEKTPWTWAQCDNPTCLKWRRLPPGVTSENLPDKWFCYMNLDPTHNRCEIEEEPEDEDALLKQGANYERRVNKQKSAEQMSRAKTITQREESVKQKEAELVRVKNEIDKLMPVNKNGADGRARAELEQAKQQLEEAKRREEEQNKIIKDLEHQKQQMELQQKRLGNAVMCSAASVSSINNIARNGVQEPSPTQRKRKLDDGVTKSAKKIATQVSDDNVACAEVPASVTRSAKKLSPQVSNDNVQSPDTAVGVTRSAKKISTQVSNDNVSCPEVATGVTRSAKKISAQVSNDVPCSDAAAGVTKSAKKMSPQVSNVDTGPEVAAVEGEDDETQDVKPQILKVKLPKRPKKSSEVIVIDSDSEVSESVQAPPVGIKQEPLDDEISDPPVIANTSTDADVQTVQPSVSENGAENSTPTRKQRKTPERANDATPVTPQTELSKVAKSVRSVRTQTLFPDNQDNAVVQLHNLRFNVAKLLKVILPDMDLVANIPLENVDSALIEVLRVNDVAADDTSMANGSSTVAKENSRLRENAENIKNQQGC